MAAGSFSFLQQVFLVLLRFVVGWHLFFQGLGKFWTVDWSARGYMENASGPWPTFSMLSPPAPRF